MIYLFYITNHGFGHATRNVPIIRSILKKDPSGEVIICTDPVRCAFLKRHFGENSRISYRDGYSETGLLLYPGTSVPDLESTRRKVQEDLAGWDERIRSEKNYFASHMPDRIVSDIIGWPLIASSAYGIPSIMLGNFTWSDMYRSFFPEEIWKPFEECCRAAGHVIWYDFHNPLLHRIRDDYETASLISRDYDERKVRQIRSAHSRPIVFVTVGGSMDLAGEYDTEGLPYDFIITQGVKLRGKNVEVLPPDMINTPDYIRASDYVISKGGWSTVAEILLARRRCALLFRGDNPEDNTVSSILSSRGQCVSFYNTDELADIASLIRKMDSLQPDSYDVYSDDRDWISDRIIQFVGGK